MPKNHLRLNEMEWWPGYLTPCGQYMSRQWTVKPHMYVLIPKLLRCGLCDRTWEGKAVLKQHGGRHE